LLNSLIPSDWQKTAHAIHSSGCQLVIAATGGGSGALAALLQTPGASRSVLEAVVPYSLPALTDWIGGKPDQACGAPTARAMAMAAFMRARQLAPAADVASLAGVGCTASLATDRPKRGERRIHVAFQRHNRTWAARASLDASPPDRAADERAATEQLLFAVATCCDVYDVNSTLQAATGRGVLAPGEQIDLLLGGRKRLVLQPGSGAGYFADDLAPPIPVVFSGAFNPLDAGHARMAEIAECKLNAPVTWELSITNVDKPPLDYISIEERVDGLRREDSGRLIALTRAPTFREKAALFPGATFVVGADTLERIAEPRYYGGDTARRDAAIAEIARAGCRFLVFGRASAGQFISLSNLQLPGELRQLCDEVPASEFREDISSTTLRQSAADS
jgi:hypothetical protein